VIALLRGRTHVLITSTKRRFAGNQMLPITGVTGKKYGLVKPTATGPAGAAGAPKKKPLNLFQVEVRVMV